MGLSKRVSIDPGDITHNQLPGRTDADAHSMAAITGLTAAIAAADGKSDDAVTDASAALSAAQAAAADAAQAAADVETLALDVGDIAALQTTAKGSTVAAINEVFTSANNGKTEIASAIGAKGGTANPTMTFAALADAIEAIPTPAEPTGTAVAADVRTGKTFSNAVGTDIAGGLDLSLLIPENIKKDITIDGQTGTLLPSSITAGDVILYSNDTEYGGGGGVYVVTYTKKEQFNCNLTGRIRVKFSMQPHGGGGVAYGRVYKNGYPIGIERVLNAGAAYTEFVEDFDVVAGDLIQLYFHNTGNISYPTSFKNFRIGINAELGSITTF